MVATRTTVVGVFTDRASAERVISNLREAGFTDDRIGMVAKTEQGKLVTTDGSGETMAGEGATAGAIAGVGVGVAVGLGVLAGVIPVVGPAIVAGTLGTILTNAVGGAAIAGIAGALIGWGIPEEDARYYENEVRSGRYLVTVDTDDRVAEAEAIMSRHGGYRRTPSR